MRGDIFSQANGLRDLIPSVGLAQGASRE